VKKAGGKYLMVNGKCLKKNILKGGLYDSKV